MGRFKVWVSEKRYRKGDDEQGTVHAVLTTLTINPGKPDDVKRQTLIPGSNSWGDDDDG